MNHKGTVTLQTERLILRRFTPHDAETIFNNFYSDPEAVRFSRWEPHTTIEETKSVISQYITEYTDTKSYNWAVVIIGTDNPIGRVAVSHLDERVSTADMTFFIGREWWHKGYASEALAEAMKFLFEEVGVNRIAGRCDVANPNSGGVMTKCGMKYEGTMKQAGKNSNGFVDVFQYGLIADDYFTQTEIKLQFIKNIPPDFSGVISITEHDSIIFQNAYGYADVVNKRKNNIDTKFGTASAGKAFVAVGIMKLIEDGKLMLQSKIGELLDFELKQVDPAITVEQLLSHTSGIPDYFDESVMDDYAALFYDYPNYRIRTSRDLLPLFIGKPMIYPKGERFQYNNTGYVVLGLIIESVSGKTFDEYLNNVIFTPLEMSGTGYYELDRLPANCANAYILDNVRGGYYTNIYSIDVKGTGAGGAFTCVGDIKRFWQGLMSGAVIRKETFANMIKPTALTSEYGYGFWLRINDDKIIPWFTGSDPGVSFISECDLERGRIITLFNNMEQNVWKLCDEIKSS